ncbi:MAG: ABC transporter ATP-binding protein [bacterium]|nr:ABC transporter ATP-binding protein [bacterium]
MKDSSESILVVKKLTKKYDNETVVKGVSFEVKRGEVFGILGPNGAGKTTTLEMIEALRPIDDGSAMIDGIDVSSHRHKIKQIIGVQLQSSSFFDKMTLKELLRMFGSLYDERVHPMKLLKDVNLSDKANAFPETLSGGQRQRFSIASALVNSPRVLFLDEPTTGLDPQARRNLWELVQNIQKKGITVVLTTHYMEEAELLCDRVAIMDKGMILQIDSPKNLIKNLLKKGFKKKQQVEQASLEDVFIELTGKDIRD